MSNEEGIKERIRNHILEANSNDELSRIRKELKEAGEKPGTIDAVVHELRKKGMLKFEEPKPAPGRSMTSRELVPAMQSFIDEVYIPRPINGKDGFWDGYEAGTRRARQDLFMSLLALQQLSSLGVAQAQPLVALAKELRPEVNPIEVAQAATEQTLNSVLPNILAVIKEQAAATPPPPPSAPNPVENMITSTVQPMFQQLMGGLMSSLMKTQTTGQMPFVGQAGMPQAGSPNQAGFTNQAGYNQATEEEIEEAFE